MIWFQRLVYLLFGGLFVYAGQIKARDPTAFLDKVRSFDLLPDPYAAFAALILPWIEILSGLAVITGLLRKGGLLILNASLLIFILAIALSWHRGLDIQCGCFGGSNEALSTDYLTLITRDVFLLAIGLLCYSWKKR